MKINPIELITDETTIRIQSLIEFKGHKDYLWYAVDRKYECYLTTEKLDAFVVAMLPLAMQIGEDLEIAGAISEKLFYNLTNYFMKMFTIFMPGTRIIRLLPEKLDDGNGYTTRGGCVTGFSGGIDSFCSVYDHYFADGVLEHYKLTHLIFNNVGGHGQGDAVKADNLFNRRYELLKGFPQELGLDFIKVDSNLDQMLPLNFSKTYTPRNISAVLLMQKLYSKYYYASSISYKASIIDDQSDFGYIDPAAIHLFSTETLECISSGCQYSRVDKTARISRIEYPQRYLNVCINDDRNCSTCCKCRRTLWTLEMIGKIDDFAGVFDLDKYRRLRFPYMIQVLSTEHPMHREIIEYAEATGYQFPLHARFFSSFCRLIPSVSLKCFKLWLKLIPKNYFFYRGSPSE